MFYLVHNSSWKIVHKCISTNFTLQNITKFYNKILNVNEERKKFMKNIERTLRAKKLSNIDWKRHLWNYTNSMNKFPEGTINTLYKRVKQRTDT